MARQEVNVTYLDGSTELVRVSPRAEVETERHYGTGIGQMLKDERAEYIYHLTWASLKYGKQRIGEDFNDWLDRVDDVDLKVDDEAADVDDPIQNAQPSTTSSDSPS